MIFTLIRYDAAFLYGTSLAIANLLVLSLMPRDTDTALLFAICGAFLAAVRPGASMFEISLPIPGRRLFLIRVISSLSAVWLPTFSAVVVLWFRQGISSPVISHLWACAFIGSLAVLLPTCVSLPESAPPKRLVAACLAATAAVGAALWNFLPPWCLSTLFAVAAIVVFLKALRSAPPTFQIAPLRASASRRVSVPVAGPLAWQPILASALTWQHVLFCLLLSFQAVFLPEWSYFLPMFVLFMLLRCRERLRWLSALPISPRSILLIAVTATVLLPVAGITIGAFFSIDPNYHRPEIRPQVLDFAGLIDYCLYIVFVLEFCHWRRLRLHRNLRMLLGGLLAIPIVAVMLAPLSGARRLLELLPHGVFPVLLVAAIPILALYALVEYQFRQSEQF